MRIKSSPAFPTPGEKGSNGMTLRDWFAGKALAGGLEQSMRDNMDIDWWHTTDTIATRAYAIADAMLKARETQP